VADRQLDKAPYPPPWLAPVVTTLGAWLVAFLVVTALLTLFGDELESLRALVISGLLVALMVNLVMPTLSAALARWLAGRPRMRLKRARPRTECGGENHA
jgi:antibiotic biosynthesis monooxygenase (ABM) superfamily enzyme